MFFNQNSFQFQLIYEHYYYIPVFNLLLPILDNSEIIIEEDPQFEKENDYVDTEHLDNEEIQQDVVLCDFYDGKIYDYMSICSTFY